MLEDDLRRIVYLILNGSRRSRQYSIRQPVIRTSGKVSLVIRLIMVSTQQASDKTIQLNCHSIIAVTYMPTIEKDNRSLVGSAKVCSRAYAITTASTIDPRFPVRSKVISDRSLPCTAGMSSKYIVRCPITAISNTMGISTEVPGELTGK
jgi:hypothetical protein